MGKGKLRQVLTGVLVCVMAFGLIASPAAAQPPEMVKVLIGFDRQPGPAEEKIVRGAGGDIKYTYHLVPAIAASIPGAAIEGLLRNPKVTSIEPDITVYAIDAELENAWGVEHIGAGIVHDGGNKGTGVKVAIIDSGIDYTHPDLAASYADGYDFFNTDDDPMDDDGHGTHVAGTVAAEDNGIGVVGVAPEAELYALKVLEGGSGSYSDVIAALEWAVTNEIQVTNNSYGSSGDPGEIVKAAFDTAYYTYGVLHVAAAGNSGTPPGRGDNVIYPARWESVIAVAATDGDDDRARWSSTGPDVELAAPGVAINSTLVGGGYGVYSGTSMASPHVAGTAALVIAAGITGNDAVRQKLVDTADDLGDAGWDSKYGYGLVDADEAAAPSAGNSAPVANAGSDQNVATGSTVQLDGTGSYDPNDDAITYSWAFSSKPTGSNATLSGADTATPTFDADKDGNYEVELTVSDDEFSSTDSVGVAAAPPAGNSAPVANAGSDQNVATGSTVQLDGTGSYDPNGDAITYSWAFSSKPADSSATLSGADTATPTFDADKDGNYEVGLTVSDGEFSSTDSVVVAAAKVTELTTVSVSSIEYATEGGRNNDRHLLITVALVDDPGNPVAGASVSIDVLLNGSLYGSGTGTTGTDGTVTFKASNAPSGTYTTEITGVTADGLTWDGIIPENSFDK